MSEEDRTGRATSPSPIGAATDADGGPPLPPSFISPAPALPPRVSVNPSKTVARVVQYPFLEMIDQGVIM